MQEKGADIVAEYGWLYRNFTYFVDELKNQYPEVIKQKSVNLWRFERNGVISATLGNSIANMRNKKKHLSVAISTSATNGYQTPSSSEVAHFSYRNQGRA